jgi:hypothetical protein
MATLALLAMLASASTGAGTAEAAPSATKACIAAHEEALLLRAQKKPHAAREKFVACARTECPAVLRQECADQIAQITKDAPTVVLEAKDDAGHDDAAVKVTMDGAPVAARLTGAAVDVEPGEHVFRFERADGKSIEQRVLVALGEKNRKVVADYASIAPKPVDREAPSPPREREARQGLSPLVYVAGGVAVVALGSFTFFALHGKSTEKDLASSCAPRCTPGDVDPVQRDYLVADVSLGVAAIATAAAILFALPSLGASSPVQSARMPPAPWMPRVRASAR